jgi:hypothetical protein
VRIEIVLTEAGAIDLKTYFEQKGFLVESIRRTAIGQITLRGLEPGQYRFLKASQVEALLSHPELGLKNIPEAGRPMPEGQGFHYRRPQGEKGERAAAEAKARGESAANPALPKPRSLTGLPKPRAAASATARPTVRPLARSGTRPGSTPSGGRSSIRVSRKKSTRD